MIFLFLVLGTLFYIYLEQRGICPGEGSLFPMLDSSGAAAIAKSDEVFTHVATQCSLPLAVGILFVVGIVSSTYSAAAGSALTALTTSFTIDILDGRKRYDESRMTSVRKRVHAAMAAMMCLSILAFERWGDASVIQLVYTVASYSYGPILGMFAFGILCRRRRVREVGACRGRGIARNMLHPAQQLRAVAGRLRVRLRDADYQRRTHGRRAAGAFIQTIADMILTADGGSTKCDWALADDEGVRYLSTRGLNPFCVR